MATKDSAAAGGGSEQQPAKADPVLTRALEKQANLDKLYAKLRPDAGGHRPLTAAEQKIQVENTHTLEEYRALQIREYSQFVAAGPIDVGNARAYNEGDPVPAANVAEHGYEERGLVRRVEREG